MGKDNQNQLAFLMEKLYLIDKQLGGTAKKRKKINKIKIRLKHTNLVTEAKGSQGEFESIHNECKQIMFSIKKKIEEIEGSKNRDKAVIV